MNHLDCVKKIKQSDLKFSDFQRVANNTAAHPRRPHSLSQKHGAMTSTYQFKLPNAKFMVSFINIFVLAVLLQSETVNAFSPRSLHRPSSILTSQTQNRYNANSSSSLKATGQNNLVAVTDSNYRALFGGEKFLLLDAYAQWYVRTRNSGGNLKCYNRCNTFSPTTMNITESTRTHHRQISNNFFFIVIAQYILGKVRSL